MRGRLMRYALWQFRDYVFERGIPQLIVSVLMFFGPVIVLRQLRQVAPDPDTFATAAMQSFIQVLPTFAFVSVLLAANGIISHDRKRGYYRFLFAKPVSVTRYYGQSFAVNWIGLLVTTLLVLLAFSALVYPVPPVGVLAFASLAYVSLGGLAFLFSAVTRLDWALLTAIYFLSQLLRAIFPPSGSVYGRALNLVLPPVHQLGTIGEALVRGTTFSSSTLLWIAGYGVVAFVVGLVVLRRRPLAS